MQNSYLHVGVQIILQVGYSFLLRTNSFPYYIINRNNYEAF